MTLLYLHQSDNYYRNNHDISLIFMDSFDQNQLNHFYPFHLFDHNQVIAKFTKQPIPSYLPLESHNHSYLQILVFTSQPAFDMPLRQIWIAVEHFIRSGSLR